MIGKQVRLIRYFFAGIALLASGSSFADPAAKPDPSKVLRYAFEVAETSFDPHKNSDVYSGIVNNAIFDTPLALRLSGAARQADRQHTGGNAGSLCRLQDLHAAGKPGIYFANDAVFGGKKRELTAEDYVYSIKRLFDPRLAAPHAVGSRGLYRRL